MQTTKSQTELIQRRPILSARQVAVAVIFGAIAAAFELLQITIPGYLPGVNFSLSGIWLTLSTMIGGPIVGAVVVFVDAVTGQVGIIGWPGFLIHVLILAAFYPAVYRIQGTTKRLGASLLLKIIPFWAQITLQFGYAYWVYLVIYFLIPAIVLATVPKYVAPQWRWPWQKEKETETESQVS